ncbi:MAG: hypothetical protein J4N85_07890 [Chloroflexi bacterium]|nr:hypothetical protein [Chloroflexota bacterium]
MDFPGELANGYHVMLDAGDVVIVRWDQVATPNKTGTNRYVNPPSVGSASLSIFTLWPQSNG